MEFCKQFNARTQQQTGLVIPVVITIYSDRSFTFITKTPPAAMLLKRAAGLAKGSGVPNRTKVGKVTRAQVREIAELKAPDLNSATVEAAERMVMGTARSMGIEIADSEGKDRMVRLDKEDASAAEGKTRARSTRSCASGSSPDARSTTLETLDWVVGRLRHRGRARSGRRRER